MRKGSNGVRPVLLIFESSFIDRRRDNAIDYPAISSLPPPQKSIPMHIPFWSLFKKVSSHTNRLAVLGLTCTTLVLAQDFTTYLEPALIANQRWARRIPIVSDLDGDGLPDVIIGQAVGTVNTNLSIQFVAVPSKRSLGGKLVNLQVIAPLGGGFPGSSVEPALSDDFLEMVATDPALGYRISRLDDTRLKIPYHIDLTSGYLGITLTRKSRIHAGWIRLEPTGLGGWTLLENAWNPVPASPIRFGSFPAQPPPTPRYDRSEFTALPEVSENFYEDVFLGRHWKTDPDTGTQLFEVRLHGPSQFLWRVKSDHPDELALMRLREPLNQTPLTGVSEVSIEEGPLLYREETDIFGTTSISGPMSASDEAYFSYFVPSPSSGSVKSLFHNHWGWLRVQRGTWTADHGKDATAVGGPSLTRFEGYDPKESIHTLMDIDGDTLVDLIREDTFESEWVDGLRFNDSFTRFARASSSLRPVQDVAFLNNPSTQTPFFPHDTTAVAGPAGNWSHATLPLWRVRLPNGIVELGRDAGWVGVRIPNAPSPSYGWVSLNAVEPVANSFGALPTVGNSYVSWRPGTGIPLGSTLPGPLILQREASQSLILIRAEGAIGTLHRRGLNADSTWIPVAGNPQEPYRITTDDAGALFRLQ